MTEEVGPEKVAEAAGRFGVPDVPPFRAISLGAVNATLEELTGAYIPFARGGLRPEPYAIETIATRDGDKLYEHAASDPVRIMTPDVSKSMNHLLYQVIHDGTGKKARLGRREAVGKTGTTNDWRDAWFVGYTRQVIAGVWVGNDQYQPMDKVTGGSIPADIWKSFMVSAHQGLPLRSLNGAYPAVSYASEPALLNFYADVSRGFEIVDRDGNARRYDRRRRRR